MSSSIDVSICDLIVKLFSTTKALFIYFFLTYQKSLWLWLLIFCNFLSKLLCNFIKIYFFKLFVIYLAKVARTGVKYQTWDIRSLKEGQKIFLKSLDNKGAISIYEEGQSSMNVLIDSNRVLQVEKMLRDRNIRYEVMSKSLNGSRNRSPTYLGLRPRSPRLLRQEIDWKDFYPLEQINTFIDNLEVQYPSICTSCVIGRSVEGREIKMLKISNSDVGNTGVWIDGGTHAREWITPSVVTYIADQFARNFETLPESITNKDWFLLPILNPDGYYLTYNGDRMWRKNRARCENITCGVDLNRNFGYYWGRSEPECSSGDPNHLNFRGPEPFSEPETTAVKDTILYSGIPFKIFVTLHSYSEVITFPWCFTSEPCPDYVNLLEGGTAIAKAIYDVNGRMYKVGNFKDLMYFATGTSIDWSYGTARIPFSYLIELRSKQHKFILPREEILDCCKEVFNGINALAEFVDKKKCLNCTMFYNKNC